MSSDNENLFVNLIHGKSYVFYKEKCSKEKEIEKEVFQAIYLSFGNDYFTVKKYELISQKGKNPPENCLVTMPTKWIKDIKETYEIILDDIHLDDINVVIS